ncbi:MAG: hypothetical protein WC149_06985 [Arcobacteraceae bacterium]
MYKNQRYVSFEEAIKFARTLNLKEPKDWDKYINGEFPDFPPLPANIPRNPREIYKGQGWWGMYDFLGIVQVIKPRTLK